MNKTLLLALGVLAAGVILMPGHAVVAAAMVIVSVPLAVWLLASPAPEPEPSPTVVCHPELPAPKLVFTHIDESVGDNGKHCVRYHFAVQNWADFPADLFADASWFGPCGDQVSSRTAVNLFAEGGRRYNGFCGLKESAALQDIWFFIGLGETPPPAVYVTLVDRICDIAYQSASTPIPAA